LKKITNIGGVLKTKTLGLVILLSFLISGCMSAISISTATVAPFASLPGYSLTSSIDVFEGPGNLDFEKTASLDPGTEVKLLGSYIDFVEIYIPKSQTYGFVHKAELVDLPEELPILSPSDVPWKKGDYIVENCMGPFTTIDSTGTVSFKPGFFGAQGAPTALFNETQLVFQYETSNDQTFYIMLSDTPPRVADNENWMLGYRKVSIFRNYAGYEYYSIEFRDGLSGNAITIPLLAVKGNSFKLVLLDPNGKKIEIRDLSDNVLYQYDTTNLSYDGTTLSLPDGLFPQSTFTMECNAGGSTLATFHTRDILQTPTGIWEDLPAAIPSLRALAAEKGMEVIGAMDGWLLGDYRYSNYYNNQVSMVYLHDFTIAGNFWLGIDQYNFDYMDQLLTYYRSQGWKVMAHLAYGNAGYGTFPADLQNSHFTSDEYLDIFHDYISTIACRYKDQVDIWQIAAESTAEVVDNPESVGSDFWGVRIGPKYVDLAYQWVRECDPDGILMLTETIDSPRDSTMADRLNNTLRKVKQMQADGIPIDAVGFEGHLFLPWDTKTIPNKESVIATMQKFGDLGLNVYITEMDVDVSWYEGTHEEKMAFQASIYKLMMDACLEAGNCRSFGVFGIDDAHSWLNCTNPNDYCSPDVYKEPLLFDKDFNPKPAFWAVVQSLQEH
jgi:endo-1,4-beta-xylanase